MTAQDSGQGFDPGFETAPDLAQADALAGRPSQKYSLLRQTLTLLGGYSLFLIVTLSGTLYYVNRNFQALQRSAQEFEAISEAVEQVNDAFIRQAKSRKNLLLRGHNPDDFQAYSARIQATTVQIEEEVDALFANPLAQPYWDKLEDFQHQHEQLMQAYDQGIALFLSGQNSPDKNKQDTKGLDTKGLDTKGLDTSDYSVADQLVRGQSSEVGERLTQVLDQIEQDRQQQLRDQEQHLKRFLLFSTSGLILVIVLGSGGLMMAIADPICRIVHFTRFLEGRQTADHWGQRYHPQQDHRPDEIGYMVKTYNDLLSLVSHANQQLQARDSLLNCVNAAVQCLVANDDLDVALPAMLKILGEGTQQCRAYVLRLSRDEKTDEEWFHLDHEWDAPTIPAKCETGGQFPVPVNAFPERLTTPLREGRATQFLARELDGICSEDRLLGQARSLVGVPIWVAGDWWGLLGLDDCWEERAWREAEIVVLATAATALGNALERDRTRAAREAAERVARIEREQAQRANELEVANGILSTRDRWLETTAIAAKQLLSSEDVGTGVAAALTTLGKNLACDRLGIMMYRPSHFSSASFLASAFASSSPSASARSSEPQPNFQPDLQSNFQGNSSQGQDAFQLLYEWSLDDLPRQMDAEELCIMPASDFPDWTEQLKAGEAVGGLVGELAEPFRSKLTELGTLHAYAVPIFLGQDFWGLMFMDYCREARQLTPPELAVFQTAASCVGSAIYQDKVRQEQAIQEQAKQEAALAKALMEERNRLAREIHDTLAQTFTGISLQLEAVRALSTSQPTSQPTSQSTSQSTSRPSAQPPEEPPHGVPDPPDRLDQAQGYILRARDLARRGLFEARHSVQALRSDALETELLPNALRKALAQTQRDTGLTTQFYLEGDDVSLSDDIQLNLLRIAQEAITNTLRYAEATQLELTLSFQIDQISLRIVDNGVGFNPHELSENRGFGLIGIHERVARLGGEFQLTSHMNQGTRLEVILPISREQS